MLKELLPSLNSDQLEAVAPDSALSDRNGTCARKRRSVRKRRERHCSVLLNENNKFPLEFG